MRILLLGGGGREHALAWRLSQSPQVEGIVALPGSDAIAAAGALCLPGDASDTATVLAAVRAQAVDLTVIGPEAPLAAGVSDALRAAGAHVFGPSRAAAQLECSKIFAKEFMVRHAIPTARFAAVDSLPQARAALARFGAPVVLKADGLAAGKGVVVAASAAEAGAAAEAMLGGGMVGAAGQRLVIEECLCGSEVSLLAVCNGSDYRLLPAARDHKRLLDGSRGPNTGGMGAISDGSLLAPAQCREIEQTIILPTLAGMAAAGTPFQGVLYSGLMLTPQGPRVLEFNVRFGDPEAQAILLRWQGDLALLLAAAAGGAPLSGLPHAALAPAAACVVAAAAGYPGAYARGERITGLDQHGQHRGVMVFHAGTRRRGEQWESAGGRVLAAGASADSREQALRSCYAALEEIQFRGMQFRRDIGQGTV